jgi:hypothetical protein
VLDFLIIRDSTNKQNWLATRIYSLKASDSASVLLYIGRIRQIVMPERMVIRSIKHHLLARALARLLPCVIMEKLIKVILQKVQDAIDARSNPIERQRFSIATEFPETELWSTIATQGYQTQLILIMTRTNLWRGYSGCQRR